MLVAVLRRSRSSERGSSVYLLEKGTLSHGVSVNLTLIERAKRGS